MLRSARTGTPPGNDESDMGNITDIAFFLAGFAMISLAADRIGEFFKKAQLPLISGFLFTGVVAGPYVLDLIPVEAVRNLGFVDEIALAFIAFAAGNELYVKELRGSLNSIRWITVGLVSSTFILGSMAMFMLADHIPFMREMPPTHRLAVSMLAGAILVARSPSSAIAVVNELRAQGPFTRTALGVTVIMDVVVIVVFAVNSSIADELLTGLGFHLGFILLLVSELAVSLFGGIMLGRLIQRILAMTIHRFAKTFMVLAAGYGVFILSGALREFSRGHLPFEILLEPLLICMVGSFTVTNHSHFRSELGKTLHSVGPPIYIAFFTLTGASLALDVLAQTWGIALVLFGVRILGIMIGSFGGGMMAGDPAEHNRIGWMCYITQAGVGLGLAKEVVAEFPEWGHPFATIIISVIVLNQIFGPPLFKWAIQIAGEARPKADKQSFDGVRDAAIFGLEGQSIALARSLRANGWEVRIFSTRSDYVNEMAGDADFDILHVPKINRGNLKRLGVDKAEAIVGMLSDDENYKVCEIAYEHFGTENLIVRLNNRSNFRRFHELEALVVDPTTAIVSLLDQFVRSPTAASLLMGMGKNRDVIEFELRNPDFEGIAIRELYLPLDVQILSLRRRGQIMMSGGFTRLMVGDWVTAVGTKSSLEEMILRFDTDPGHGLFHIVQKVTPRELSSKTLGNDVKKIIDSSDDMRRKRFDGLIRGSVVLDLDAAVRYDAFFRQVAEVMAPELGLSEGSLYELMMAREAECSTALRPDLAIPHIIIEGTRTFGILLARCRPGIYFSELAPRVQSVFVLLGTRDERNYHLYALSSIAGMVQDAQFSNKWMRAKDKWALRKVVLDRKEN